MGSGFSHLHTHSHYSLLSALPKIPDLVGEARALGMKALALTDNGNLYGAIEFYKECKARGVKPIIGVDAYTAARSRFDKEAGIDNRRARLVLLAKNLAGYRNLLQLVTKSHVEGFYYKPRVDKELLQLHGEGLIALIPSFSGEVALALKARDKEKAAAKLKEYADIFGRDNVYLEITHHPEIEGHQGLSRDIVSLSRESGIPLAAAHDVYYLRPEDKRARDTLLSVQNAGGGNNERGVGDEEEDFSFVDQKTAENYFKDLPEALRGTATIVELCNLDIPLGTWAFPTFPIPEGLTYNEELRKAVFAGFSRRGIPTDDKEVAERVEYELSVIKSKGYASYFLVVADLLREAHARGILTTIRGSVAGSMVTYLAGITNVNPLEYKLPFERFLNPERPSAPDIDMDFQDNRRDEMIEYAKGKYGADKVAQIGTFGTMMARGAVRDVARALGYPYGLGDRIAREIPMGSQGFPMTLKRAFELNQELRKMYKGEKDVREIIDVAKKIEGCVRHISIHAAGVVIAPTPLTDYTPLQCDPKGENKIITQYDMYAIDENNAGLLKFDFLGIKNLTILANAVEIVKKTRGIAVDIENVPLDDKKTFAMLARGETEGLFQLNGSGMTRFLVDLKPSSIHDINAMVALYRPGPMEMIPEYIKRKHNPALVSYLDPRMKEILDRSYGVIAYQDDVLMVAVTLGGYSWLEADKLRKAMGKKIPAEMEAEREKLIAGFIKNGISKEKAQKIWKLIEPFAAYGFNKAHAASYGRVAYQTAYMKANFPVEYMAAVLTADAGNVEQIAVFINECKRMGIPVLPPDVNESLGDFTVVKTSEGADSIRFGLRSIKNFGESVADSIKEERKKNGPFVSLADFLSRITDRNLNKKSLEALIKCGALDSLGERGAMLANMDALLRFNKDSQSEAAAAQDSLFGALSGASPFNALRLEQAAAASQEQKLAWEKELLGLYVSGHPLDRFREKLAQKKLTIAHVKNELREGMIGVVCGIVEEVKPILTKSGEQMAFLKIADYSGSLEVVIFPRLMGAHKNILSPESCISIKGRMSARNGFTSMIAEAIKPL